MFEWTTLIFIHKFTIFDSIIQLKIIMKKCH
jgi:hypothetical protein